MLIINLKKMIHKWVNDLTNVPEKNIFWTEQNIAIPQQGPYITLKIEGPGKIGKDTHTFDQETYSQTGYRTYAIYIQAFRDGYEDRLIDLHASTDDKITTDLYFNHQLSFTSVSDIRNLSSLAPNNLNIEPRTGFDVTILTNYSRSYKSSTFESAVFEELSDGRSFEFR